MLLEGRVSIPVRGLRTQEEEGASMLLATIFCEHEDRTYMHRSTLLALLLQGVAVLGSIADCGKGTSLFQINGLGFWPDPPTPGENSTLSFLYTVPDGTVPITDGTAEYAFSLNGIPFPATVDPLCDDAQVCPIGPGQYNLTTTSTFPTGVSGKISTTISWYDLAKTLLLCVQTVVRV